MGWSSKRAYLLAMVILAAAGGLLLLATGMPWLIADGIGQAALGPAGQQQWSGEQVAPLARAVGLVALAGIAGTVASRGKGRIAVGVVLALAGVVGAWSAITTAEAPVAPSSPGEPVHATAWPWLAFAAGAVIASSGAVVASIGARWPGLGSRYQRDAARAARSPWEALDDGQDPTA